jgi:2-methylaconitate cis-trans-isomerase PrpF
MDDEEQQGVRAVLMRGGTSKALFFHRADLPAAGEAQDALLKRIMGTPDPLQIDGLGGAVLSTSKVAIVSRSAREDADVDYSFVQVEVTRDAVDHELNCGNISSAVGPFAIDEGLVTSTEPVTTVRIWNTNTESLLVAKVPVQRGKARVLGDCAISGVPGTGAEILMDYAGTIGARTGAMLPTGRPVDTISMEDGRHLQVTFCDVANPCVFVAAESLGLRGTELPAAIVGNASLMVAIHELRGKAGLRFGFWTDWRAKGLPSMPMLVIVSPPADCTMLDGRTMRQDEADVCARLIFIDQCHPSMAGTGSICLAAASRIAGSVVHRALAPGRWALPEIRIGHPSGVTPVKALIDSATTGSEACFAALGFARTARRLMNGTVYVPSR